MNHAPSLVPIPPSTILAGLTLLLTNTAIDPAVPAETLTWSLLAAPPGAAIASINITNGVLSWRPAMAQSPSTNLFSVVVTDNGTPQLSATQSAAVIVLQPPSPQMGGPAWSHGSFGLTVNGDAGPDYILAATTNLGPAARWIPLVTNLSATPPWTWTDSLAGSLPQKFYRVQLGP
jgi:hypothetical protein